MSNLVVTPEIKQAIKDVEIDDDAHWLLGDYGREARTWGHVDLLFETNLLSMEGNALQNLKKKALTTYHLKVHSEALAKLQEQSTIAEIITLAEEIHERLINALKHLEEDTVDTSRVTVTNAPPRATNALPRAMDATHRATGAPTPASHGPARAPRPPTRASGVRRATQGPPNRAAEVQASVARQAAIRDAAQRANN